MISKIMEQDISNIISEVAPLIKKYEGKRILITGANGFLGSHIVDVLVGLNKELKEPCKLVLINRNEINEMSRLSHLRNDPNIKFFALDIGKQFILNEKVDIIIHAASRSNPTTNFEDPLDTIDANIKGLKTLLEYAKNNKIEEFLFFSSAEVYGNPTIDFIPTPESYLGNINPLDKRACYGESKRLGETICMAYFNKFNIPVKILRIFNIYGPGLRNDGKTIAEFFSQGIKDKKIIIKSDGTALRSFCYISDAITAIIKVMAQGKQGEVYNIGDDMNNVSIRELAYLIKDIINNNCEVSILGKSNNTQKTYGVDTRHPDITKLRKLGFSPLVSLHNGLQRTREYYESGNDI